MARRVSARLAWQGRARRGDAWRCEVWWGWLGTAGSGVARHVVAGMAWLGRARRVEACLGPVRPGRQFREVTA